MKKLLLFGLLISMSVMSYAGVLLTKSGARIENVTIVSVTDTEVIYSVNNGEPITISKNDLSAILYDDGRYEEIRVKENSNVVSSIGNNTESTGYNTPVWPNQMGESWKEDWKLFCKNSPNEVKEVTKAINLVVRKQGIFNFSGAADIDRQANDAYLNAKANGLSGEDAVRARNTVYINRANELSGSNFNTTQENPTYTSSNAANTFNLLAYGVFKGSKNYEVCHDYDGAVVEYRIIIKEGKQTIYTEYQQIGVVPFAFVSESFKQSYCATYTKFNIDLPEEVSYMQTIPFVVNGIDDTNKRNVTIQYRISKEGYKTVTVFWPETMLPQGEAICLPLNMLKPLSAKEKEKIGNTNSENNQDNYIESPNVVPDIVKIERLDKNLYTYGGTEMDTKAMIEFLRNNCPDAYSKYTNSKTLIKAGWGVFATGLAMTIGGAVMMGVWEDYHHFGDYTLLAGGVSLVCIGPISTCCAGIPLLCVGYHRTNHAHEIFNRQCATKEKLTLNLQASQNGLGLALNF